MEARRVVASAGRVMFLAFPFPSPYIGTGLKGNAFPLLKACTPLPG